MSSAYHKLENVLGAIGRWRLFGPRSFHYICGPVCGTLCAIFFIISLGLAHQLPPIPAHFTPEQTTEFWREHETGARWGAALMMISTTFYLPYTASISAQMRRVPNLPYLASALQLAAGAAGLFTFITPAQVLALIPFRLDRSPEATQTLTDLFFFFLLMPWPSFIVQDWAWAYAILIDQRERPVFPKFMAIFNIIIPIMFLPTLGMHAHKRGAVAYQGALTFWFVGIPFIVQLLLDSICLFVAIRADPLDPTVNLSAPLLKSGDETKGVNEEDAGPTLSGNSV
ncbi:membrane protein [Ilyonectria destructans]|nr:membrane protein [Ilyonectria destructans]